MLGPDIVPKVFEKRKVTESVKKAEIHPPPLRTDRRTSIAHSNEVPEPKDIANIYLQFKER